ncbi:hypothetical protein A5906_23645 [Bradyrhizobium sacchari]|uniref:Uncharacterized protein n=1 Tax=Bradyrhizobium sacchari TaxID=1399419 RepID=A0A560JU39_9BRAD|nr:hypothetical protein [Bradyrhizobium sacchari]OPZ00205.1 hypothetical protein A5906_23645 [Bradyrhizobium sacchari]TWB60012.1 hypothetical protein FBZ94_104236 [Bradyrhizobium sacchari]TWB74179.1 hypothetical protein FBZ95_105430 [Bradyrhizobium sacchari]
MLPGFRFLLAAILLSTSILVFGLGAAALLRATHEQYVSTPSWRNGPQEQVFAQAPEPAQPVLAALRADPEAAAEPMPSLRDWMPTIGLPASESEQAAAATTETDTQPQPPQATPPAAEPAKAEIGAEIGTEIKAEVKAETKPEMIVAAAAPTDTLTPADSTATIPEARPAATVPEAPRTATTVLASRVADIAAARMAALNDLTRAKTKADSNASKPRASKPKKRHRIVRRPPPQQINQALDPFGRPQQTFATTTTARAR